MHTYFPALLYRLAVLSGVWLLVASPALARDDWNHPYWHIGFHGSQNWATTSDGTYTTLQSLLDPNEKIKHDTDIGWGIALGTTSPLTPWGDRRMRLELELARRHSGAKVVEDAAATTSSGITPEGIQMTSYMLNIVYEALFTRHLGMYAGVGGGWMELEFEGLEDDTVTYDLNDRDFGAQFMIGAMYEPRFMPHTSWGIGYRYIRNFNIIPSYVADSRDTDYEAHAAEASLRIRF